MIGLERLATLAPSEPLLAEGASQLFHESGVPPGGPFKFLPGLY